MRVNAKILGMLVLLALTLAGSLPSAGAATAAQHPSLAPSTLSISIVPSKLPADNNVYPAVVVTVVDNQGQPTTALKDVQVSLTSSQENVGVVTPSVTIPAGQAYAIANLTTTHTPGTTILTATSLGYVSTSALVTTIIAVGYPTHLVIQAVPRVVPARASNTGYLILEEEDDVGLPAKAISDAKISLYSSNTNVVNVTRATTVLKQGDYLEEVTYTSGFIPGSATVTASAGGFDSGTVTVSVQGSPPLALKLLAQPSTMVACTKVIASCTGRLVAALTDLAGNPTIATHDIQVQIRSSNLAVVAAQPTMTIKAGNISAIATFNVTANAVPPGKPYLATVAASSPGLSSGFATITVEAPVVVSPSYCTTPPSTLCHLAIYAGPSPVLADHRSYSSVVVSLQADSQDGSGPAAVNQTGPTEVTLTSSLTGVGNFTRITFYIPKGQNWAAVAFTSTFQVGTTTLTASAQNFLPTQTALGTYGPVPSNVILTAISKTLPADGQTHPVLELSLVDAFGSPAIAPFDVPVSLSSSQSEVVSVSTAVIPGGQTFAIVNVTAGVLHGTANVTALVSSFTTGYTYSSTLVSTVIPAPSGLGAYMPNGGQIEPTTGTQPPLLAIQLQDSGFSPARARTPINVTITSSNSTVITQSLFALIAPGQDYVVMPVSPAVPGITTLTLSAPGLSTTSIVASFLPGPMQVTIDGGPKTLLTNQTAVISVHLMIDGSPGAGAAVIWTTSDGGLIIPPHPAATNSSSAATTTTATTTASKTATTPQAGQPKVNDTTGKTGSSTVVFKPSKPGTAVITAMVSPSGLAPKALNFTVTASSPPPPPPPKPKPSLIQEFTTFPMLLVPVGAAGGIGALAIVLIRRRGRGGGEEEFDTAIE